MSCMNVLISVNDKVVGSPTNVKEKSLFIYGGALGLPKKQTVLYISGETFLFQMTILHQSFINLSSESNYV